eukprot:457915_1
MATQKTTSVITRTSIQMDPSQEIIDQMTDETYRDFKKTLLSNLPPFESIVNAQTMNKRKIDNTFQAFQWIPQNIDPQSAFKRSYYQVFMNWKMKQTDTKS